MFFHSNVIRGTICLFTVSEICQECWTSFWNTSARVRLVIASCIPEFPQFGFLVLNVHEVSNNLSRIQNW